MGKPKSEQDELEEFLQHWLVVREGLITKYKQKILWWRTQSNVPLTSDRMKLQHYEHERRMLTLLQSRLRESPYAPRT